MNYRMLMWIIEDPMGLTWQGFIILNGGGLLALSFFLGTLATRVNNLEKRDGEARASLTESVETIKETMDRMQENMSAMVSERTTDRVWVQELVEKSRHNFRNEIQNLFGSFESRLRDVERKVDKLIQ